MAFPALLKFFNNRLFSLGIGIAGIIAAIGIASLTIVVSISMELGAVQTKLKVIERNQPANLKTELSSIRMALEKLAKQKQALSPTPGPSPGK